MKRKVNRVGSNTLTVSLPSRWAKQFGIKPGDELELVEDSENLVIGAKISKKRKEITIKLRSSYPKYIKAIMRNLYLHGYEIIKVTYNEEKDYVTISNVIEGVVGFEIIKDSQNSCVIESISEINYEQYIIFLNKLFQVIITMQDVLKDGLKNKPTDVNASIISSLNKKSSKYACLCRRTLTKNSLMNNDDSLVIFYLIGLIHMVARNYANCYKYIHENKVKINRDILDYLAESSAIFRELYDLYLKKKKGSLGITEKRHHLLSKVLPDMFSKGADPMVLHYLAEVVRISGTCAPKVNLMNEFLEDGVSRELL